MRYFNSCRARGALGIRFQNGTFASLKEWLTRNVRLRANAPALYPACHSTPVTAAAASDVGGDEYRCKGAANGCNGAQKRQRGKRSRRNRSFRRMMDPGVLARAAAFGKVAAVRARIACGSEMDREGGVRKEESASIARSPDGSFCCA